MKNSKLKEFILGMTLILAVPFAQGNTYATRTESTNTAILIENLDPQGPEFSRLCRIALNEVTKWCTKTRPPLFCISQMSQLEKLKQDPHKLYGTLVKMSDRGSHLTLSFHSLINEDPIYPVDVIKGDFNKRDSNFVHALQTAISDYGGFDRNKVAIREHFIQNFVAAQMIETKKQQPENSTIPAAEISVDQQEFNRAYADFNRRDPDNKRYVAAGLMSAAVLGVGTLNYYRQHNPNVVFEDDDYTTFGDSMKHRLDFSAVRFDDNTQLTNIGHMYAGTVHYNLARSSGLNRWESLLQTFVLSSLWEYIAEYKQSVSLNDQIATTLGGFIVGESVHQMAKILKKDTNNPIKKILAGIFGGPEKASQWIESRARGQDNMYDDSLGSAQQDFWSKMGLYINVEKRNGKTVKSGGIESEIINIPKFNEPGEYAGLLLDDTVQSKLKIEMGRADNLKTFKLFAKTTLAAFYKKKMQLSETEKLSGYQFFVGPAMMVDTDVRIADHRQNGPNSDIHGVIGVLGNTLDVRAVRGDLQIHAVIDVYGDFGIIRSLSFSPATNNQYPREDYIPSNCDGYQSVMCNYSYYYGLGWTKMANFDLRYKALTAGLDASKTTLKSIESLSRFGQSQRLNAMDSVSKKGAWVAYEINRDIRVELGVEKRVHTSRFGTKSVTAKEAIARGRLIFVLD